MLTSERFNIPVIGGGFISSPKQVKQAIAKVTPTRLVLFPDAGCFNNSHVMRQYEGLKEIIEEFDNNLDLTIAWWDQWEKSDGDIDEIGAERKIEYLPFRCFLDLQEQAQKRQNQAAKEEVKGNNKNQEQLPKNNQETTDKGEFTEKQKVPAQRGKRDYVVKHIGPVRYNELTLTIENGSGKEIEDVELFYLNDAIVNYPFHGRIGKDFCLDVILWKAKQNSYHPVREFLDGLNFAPDNDCPYNINNLAELFFGITDSLSNILLKRFLISAVARIYEPGCFIKLCLILQGPQSFGKSSFWYSLFGEEFFSDSLGSLANIKDDLLVLHRSWGCEWGEIERIARKREAEEIKDFLTRRFDDFRQPYGRQNKRHLRQSVIVGSANTRSFLKDTTGSARFGVLEIKSPININRVAEWRRYVWWLAREAYRAKEPWLLTSEELKLSEENNSQFEDLDPWVPLLEAYIDSPDSRRPITTDDLLTGLCIEPGRRTKGDAFRISQCMTSLGYKKGARITIDNKKTQIWEKEE